MTTVASLVDEVAQLLNDAEPDYPNIRWTRPEIVEYANDGVAQIALLRADLFEHTETVTLKPGDRQTLPDNALFYRVDGTLDARGQLQGRPFAVDAVSSRVAALWFDALACRDSCVARNRPYVISSWTFDPADPSTFYVSPPVPASPPVQAVVTVSSAPERGNEDTDLPGAMRFHNAIIEWMLYRAYSKDEDSQTSLARMDRHKAHFYEILGLSQRADDRLYRTSKSTLGVVNAKPD